MNAHVCRPSIYVSIYTHIFNINALILKAYRKRAVFVRFKPFREAATACGWEISITLVDVYNTLECPREKLARAQEYSSINVRNQRVRCDCGSCEEKCYREVRWFDETKLANVNPTGILRFSNFPETFFVLLFIIYIWLIYKCLKNLLYFIINWFSNFEISTINGDKLPHKNDVLLIILIRQTIFDNVNFFPNTSSRSM